MSNSSLCEAVKNGEYVNLNGLIVAGANVNEQDGHGWTPLCWAQAAATPKPLGCCWSTVRTCSRPGVIDGHLT